MMDLEAWKASRSVECGLGIKFGRKTGVGARGLFLGIFRCEKSGRRLSSSLTRHNLTGKRAICSQELGIVCAS